MEDRKSGAGGVVGAVLFCLNAIGLRVKLCIVGVVLVVVSGGCASSGMRQFDAGPLVSADSDVHGDARTRALGPFIETRQRDDGMKFLAVRPFYSHADDPERNRSISDYLWPLGMGKKLWGELDWRFFPMLGHDSDISDSDSRHRWSIFPLVYGGQSVTGEKYFAFFPLGGTIYDFIGRDFVAFVLFPLYSYSVQDDNKTWSFLWPIFSITHGDDLFRWRIFPFYGVSHNIGRWKKRFVLWPFWTSVHYEYPDQKGGGFILFPLFGRVRVGENYSYTLFPPFFKYEKGKNGHRKLFCPWPLVRYKRGKVNQFYIWPLFGKKRVGVDRKWFVLWPFFEDRHVEREEYLIHRFKAVPLVSYETRVKREKDGDTKDAKPFFRYLKLWPLLSYQRRHDVLRFSVLALWPMRNPAAVERSWAPLWRLFSYERDGSTAETEFLWGMYRHRRDSESSRVSLFPVFQASSQVQPDGNKERKWSILYGLMGYKRDGLRKQIKLLYFIKFGWGAGADQMKRLGGANDKAGSL